MKLGSKSMNKTDNVVSSGADKTLVARNGDVTEEAEKRNRAFSTFSVSLGREKIDADLLAMTEGSRLSRRVVANKKRTTSLSFRDDLSSFPADKSSDLMRSRYNLATETSENESTLVDASDKKKNDDMVAGNEGDQSQTLISVKFEEPEKVRTRKNSAKVSEVANETLNAKNGNVAESLPPESPQPGIAPLTKHNGENFKKRTFSTFSVSLTQEEIEADFLAMGGSMRTRRIKKRPKNLQRQLDNLFPGLRLKYITPDDYKVRERKN